ncbi:lytic transglycosylase domain-containing protein [Xanthobacter autotrophicus]|uniref:Lytic transglycosylase domain-containing protein n=1 Tax=Xanthobacter autotrophicus TaxID=280 RepID=A0A6C1KKM3_XANAU|nr:lytic transglycosylase domain-containing protein [Xanthobacter autotrophicus]TLX44868.1 lytic transglycosylase domain-containing protein [Xanthobacter autotrophicus]
MLQTDPFLRVPILVLVSMRAHARRHAVVFVLLSGVPFGWSTAVLTAEAPATQKLSSPADRYADFITEAAERFDIPAGWIRSVLRAESDGDARSTSPKGAMGLMQIMPQTWAELRVHYGLGDDPYDPHDNIMAGAAYLRELFDRYGHPGFLAAYNAGPSRYEASRKGRTLPQETRTYVEALAPVIAPDDAGADASRVSAAPQPEQPSWARAPIFILPPARTSTTVPAPRERLPAEATATSAVRDVSAIVPPSTGLFVTRPGTGGAR